MAKPRIEEIDGFFVKKQYSKGDDIGGESYSWDVFGDRELKRKLGHVEKYSIGDIGNIRDDEWVVNITWAGGSSDEGDGKLKQFILALDLMQRLAKVI